MENQKTNIEQMYRGLVVTWFALFVSQFLFLLVLYFVKPELFQFDFSQPLLPGKFAIIVGIFALVAITNLAISFLIRKKYLDQAVTDQNVHFVQTALITGSALCESVSLFGLMLAFVADYQYFFLWFILGIAGMIFHFPRRDSLIAAVYKKIHNNKYFSQHLVKFFLTFRELFCELRCLSKKDARAFTSKIQKFYWRKL